MHFDDLSPYTYGSAASDGRGVNVGWLDAPHGFPTGDTLPELRARLAVLVERGETGGMMGFHACTLGHQVDERHVGNGEIIALGADGTRYHAPTLILHYVEAHHYRPPQEFVDAVLRTASLSWAEAARDDLCLACAVRMTEALRLDAHRFLDCPSCGRRYGRSVRGLHLLHRKRGGGVAVVPVEAEPLWLVAGGVERTASPDADARVERRGGQCWVVDLRGRTTCAGQPVGTGRPLAHRDEIVCGQAYSMTFIDGG